MPLIDSISSEPIIRVGIILPEDKRDIIRIHIPINNDEPDNKNVSGELVISPYENQLVLDNKIYDEIHLSSDNPNDFLTIDSVPAGRGFHWQKNIDIQILGDVYIKNINGYMLLVNQLPLETYLLNVATAEMNPDCPSALLESQTIAARSWLLANQKVNHPDADFDVCNDDCCQRYQGVVKISDNNRQAIKNTRGKVLSYQNEICDARYSKCCGGITESFENVWGGKPVAYLSNINDNEQDDFQINIIDHINSSPNSYCSPHFVDAYDLEKYLGIVDSVESYFRWNIEYTQRKLISILKIKLNINISALSDLIPVKRGNSGRIIELRIDYIDNNDSKKSIYLESEYDIRNALHEKFLYSSAFLIEKETDKNEILTKIIFKGAGWGHGVGLCQIGALGMALKGYSSEAILKHYFKGTNINKLF